MKLYSLRNRIIGRILYVTGTRFGAHHRHEETIVYRICGSTALCNQVADRLTLGVSL
jgi:hypothetical protein